MCIAPQHSPVMRVGERIREIRRRLDWSQEYVGEKAGISGAYLSKIEKGDSDPDTELLKRIAKALAVDPATLLDDDETHAAVIRFSMPGHISTDERQRIEELLTNLSQLPRGEKDLIYDIIDTVLRRRRPK